jgi:hypothetical protein
VALQRAEMSKKKGGAARGGTSADLKASARSAPYIRCVLKRRAQAEELLQAVVLADGLGTRFAPISLERPSVRGAIRTARMREVRER